MPEFIDPDTGVTISGDVSQHGQWEPHDPDANTVEGALGRVDELGLDEEAVAGTMRRYIAEGYDAASALKAAVEWHDLSDCGDELAALQVISAREGWS